MSEPREEDEIEMTDNEVGEYDQDITSPFSVNNIKVTHATVMLPTIINRLKRKEIGIPDYQRQADLWSNNQKSRLIESILLKLPLPVFYFDVSDPEKWMVIDGLQRISTIKSFFVKQTLKLKGLEFLIETSLSVISISSSSLGSDIMYSYKFFLNLNCGLFYRQKFNKNILK
jgi:uncharacterized protein with ParB-like and HNH nuclease domain